ncbi:MAG TPA: RidA family protein, partial [Planctomycetota bacterium]|nr:RidA family protein [Planctomycetota bacterium]
MKEIILTQNAPAPVGPYSQAVKVDGWVFASGQIPIDPQTGRMIEGGVAEQTRRVLQNLREVLAAAGVTVNDVVKTTVYMTDLGQFAEMNTVYAEFFGDAAPARATVEVAKLPKNSLVEIECIAHV